MEFIDFNFQSDYDDSKSILGYIYTLNGGASWPHLDSPVLLYCDSTGIIAQAKESKSHQWIKHILYRYHLVWKIVDQDDVELQKINRKENLTDPFTKALDVKEFETIN